MTGTELTCSNTPSSSWKMPTTRTRSPISATVSVSSVSRAVTTSPFPKMPSTKVRSVNSPLLGASSTCQVNAIALGSTWPTLDTLSASLTLATEAVMTMSTSGVPKISIAPSAGVLGAAPAKAPAVPLGIVTIASRKISRSTLRTRSRPSLSARAELSTISMNPSGSPRPSGPPKRSAGFPRPSLSIE